MRGLGRNIRFQVRSLHQLVKSILPMLIAFCILDGLWEGWEYVTSTMMPFVVMMLFFLVLMGGLNGNGYLKRIAIPLGSARRQGSLAVIIMQHILLVEMAVLAIAGILLIEENRMIDMIRKCPLLVIGAALFLTGLSTLLSIVSTGVYAKKGAALFIVLFLVSFFAGLGITLFPYLVSVDKISQMNQPLIFLIGLLTDAVTAFLYYKIVQKTDIKIS